MFILLKCESFGDMIFCVCVSEFIALILVPSLPSHFGILVMLCYSVVQLGFLNLKISSTDLSVTMDV